MGLLSLIPPEFQAANFGDSHVVRQQPAHTHAGARLVWRWQLLHLPSTAAWEMPGAILCGSKAKSAISRAAVLLPAQILPCCSCVSRVGEKAGVTPHQEPCGN